MHRADIAKTFEATVVLSTLATLVVGLVVAARSKHAEPRIPNSQSQSQSHSQFSFSLSSLFAHPLVQLCLVSALIYVNQILFGAFILRAHGGSTAFIGRYIPGEWFAIGTQDPLVAFAARHVGDGQWLSPTLLRVQAFLELPFTIFAYLAVARLLGRGLYATLVQPAILALVSLSFSVTFSLVEVSLPNPYTHDDLVLRAVACVLVPVYIACISRLEARRAPAEVPAGPSGVLGLLAFLAGAGGLSYVVLALYDAFLLYNLAHLPRYASGIAVSLLVAAAASFAAPRIDEALARATGARVPSPAIDVCVSALRAFTLLFFVPSLSLRYWGAHPTAAACGALVVVLGLGAGAVKALRRSPPGVGGLVRLVVAGGAALALGGWAAHLAFVTAGLGMPELLLARVSLSFLAVAIVIFRAGEIALCWGTHETKASADEA
jgi:hypothetical protein